MRKYPDPARHHPGYIAPRNAVRTTAERIPARPWTIEDVRWCRGVFARVAGENRTRIDWYREITEPAKGHPATAYDAAFTLDQENYARYEELYVRTLINWWNWVRAGSTEILAKRPALAETVKYIRENDPPKNLREIRAAFLAHPYLDEFGPIQHQDGPEHASIFTHFRTERLTWYRREMPSGPRAGRVYLNPKNEYVPIIAYEIMLRATEQGRPIYFKIADQAFFRGYGTPEKTRMDKILFYVPKEDLAFVIDLAKSLAGTNPEAFEGRPTNPMLSPVAPGIGYGADVTAAQKSRSTTGSASFSQVRANLLGDLWENTVANILAEYWESTNPKASAMKASFVRSLASGIGADGKFCGKTVDIAREATMLRKARFNWEAYRDQGGILWKNNICNALGETAIGHFPKLSATSLYQWSSAVLPAVAAKHGIDPDDLARNIAEKP